MTDDLTASEKAMLARLLEEASHSERQFLDSLSAHEKSIAIAMLQDYLAEDDPNRLGVLWDIDYLRKPVDVETFITEKDYLGLNIIDSMEAEARSAGLFKTWADTMIELFRPDKNYWELILSSSIGTGKTSCAVLALVYKLYKLSCLRDPQSFYGLLPGHAIVFGVYNIFKYKAQSVAASYLREAIDRSPYFKEVFPVNPNKTLDIEFQKSIKVSYGATSLHAIGENIFSVLIDETEFMKAAASEEEKGQAWELYTSTLRRMESRYMRGGEIPGLMIQISSKASADSYLSERIKNRGSADNVLIVEKTGWDVKPWRYGGKRFWVFIGDNYSDPRVLTDAEYDEAKDKTGIMAVPIEHKLAFDEDIHGSLRDLANVASDSASPLIPRRDRIIEAIDETRHHPFSKMEFHIGIDDDDCIEDYFDADLLLKTVQSRFVPRIRPGVGRFIHVDLAYSRDSVGFCMGHVSHFTEIEREDRNTPGHKNEIKLPNIYIDLLLRVVSKKGTEIRLSAVRDFVFALRSYGFVIAKLSADTFQSVDMIQQLNRAGIPSEHFSVDAATEKLGHPYAFTKEAIMERRISYYNYPILISELANLQRFDVISGGKIKWKVDHPQKMNGPDGVQIVGSKDVADSLAGVIRHCMMMDPDVDPPPTPPIVGLIDIVGSKNKSPRFRTDDGGWAIGSDYTP